MKYYAVKKGNKIGVFDNWVDCQKATKGFSKPKFKSFNTIEEAEAYLNDENIYLNQIKDDIKEGFVVAYCDGSYDKEANRYSYGVLIIDDNLKEHEIYGMGNNVKYLDSKNIAGEVLGLINAMDWAISNNRLKIKIYHDYEGLSKWINKEWKANSAIAKALVAIYDSKYAGVLDIKFEKVKGHSNNVYNDKVDELAKYALNNRARLTVKGDSWFSIPHFKINELKTIIELLNEEEKEIKIDKNIDDIIKLQYKMKFRKDKLTLTLFKTSNRKLLVQGSNCLLLQMVTAYIVELLGIDKVDNVLKDAYKMNINKKNIDDIYNDFCKQFPSDYPENIKVLLRQSIINLKYCIESVDYGQYIFPACRALEGHTKYLLNKQGVIVTVKNGFSMFNKDEIGNYCLTDKKVKDINKKNNIELCYNYYKKTRDTVFHFGDIMGSTDSTRMLNNKEESDEIITKCLKYICEI